MIGRILTLGLIIFFTAKAGAQQFGAFPPSTRWQQIDSDTARVIFDAKVSPQAQRIAAILHRMMQEDRASLGGTVRKIHILLHPNTTQANGYVALAPFRSEYYLIPSSNLFETGATPWNEDLAIHEYRHVQQYSNFNKGLSKAAGFVFGQNGQALFNALAVPDWFWEGDAVHSETALTVQGRGRSPYFFNGFRALWKEGRDYNWMKLRNGSLKDYVPNHYQLGYLLTNYGYLQHGQAFWGKVTDDAVRFRSLFYPFQKAVKRASGKDFKTFRTEALQYYKQASEVAQEPSVKRETVTDYLFPKLIGQDSVIYIKTAYNKIPAFYLKDGKGEQRIRLRNISSEDWLAYSKGTIAYTAYTVHPRWGLTDYSDIYLLDIATRGEKRLTNKGRYFTPTFSPDGNTIAAVAYTDSAENEIHLLNREGNVVRRITPQETGDLFVHPHFATDSMLVVAVRHADATMSLQGVTISDIHPTEARFQTLLLPTNAILGYPVAEKSRVYFVSSVTGSDNIFSLDLSGSLPAESVRQHTTETTGAYYPTVYRDSLLFSTFTSNGFRLRGTTISGGKPVEREAEFFQHREEPYTVALDTITTNLLDAAGEGDYPVKPYKNSTGLLNFHSRQVNYTDPEITASIFSDNILNTFSNEIFYRYNQNESSHAVGFNTYYGGLFPVINGGFTYTANRTRRTTTSIVTLDQKELRVGYYIPLNFTAGRTFKSLVFGNDFVYNETTPTGASRNIIRGISSTYLQHFLQWSQRLPRAVQHIFPRFAYTVNLSHRHLLAEKGFQFLGGATVALPSIRNHSLVLGANWQETDTLNVVFSNRFANSRGYNDFYFSRMWRLTGNYHMPLLYPDWGFGNILYFLRVRSNFFFDYTRVYARNKIQSQEQRSVGGEIYFDTRWWNALPVSFGFRVSRLLDNDFSGTRPAGSTVFEFILPVDLIPR
ncbi:MAG TPA: hypothetical protein VGN63_09440 [Flavisolibacter sp.]|jgi:hypothetical protein|nr:hypothetical protein [Flavisolibacter sp.]